MNNNDEIYINDVIMEEERMEEKSKFQASPQTKTILIQMKGEERMKDFFLKIASSKKLVET